jgi:hypothetical protein
MPRGRLTAAAIALVTLSTLVACTDADGSGQPGPTAPTAPIASAVTATSTDLVVRRTTFTVVYRLEGATEISEAIGIDIPVGMALTSSAEAGRQVTRGGLLGRLGIRPEVQRQLEDASRQGTVGVSRQAALRERERQLRVPATGILTMSPGRRPTIASIGLDATVPLAPLQELRYRGMTFVGEVTLETLLGERRVACGAIWIEGPEVATDPASGSAGRSSVHCRLPDDVESTAGLPVTLTLTSAEHPHVVAVPSVYIGLDRSGDNYIARVRQAGGWVDRPVVVGATDGVRRIVVSGLKPGEVVTPIVPS